MIDSASRVRLLGLARVALEARVRRQPLPVAPGDVVVDAFGVFVTVHHLGDLRGCLGSLDAHEPVVEAVIRLAAAVAHEDRRFSPLGAHELAGVTIDLSVLTRPERVSDHLTIEVGRHGLIVELNGRKGLLLPQVAPEHGWDRETFLAHTCIKAGLSPSAWQSGASLYRFEAEVFG